MRSDLTIPELIVHSRLWQLAQSQLNRQTRLGSDPDKESGFKKEKKREWLAPAFTRILDRGLSRPDYGYCVAFKETQNCYGMEGLKRAIIHASDVGDGIIGGWYYEGKFYFDSVKKVNNRVLAENLAVLNGQIGIYHLTTETYIPTPDATGTYNLITEDNFIKNKPGRRHSTIF